MSTRKRERYSLRSECRDHGSCSCRNALDSKPASARRTPRNKNSLSSSKSHIESSETSDFSDYGSISPEYTYINANSDSKEISSGSDLDFDSHSIIYENCHTYACRSVKRVTFSDIVDYDSTISEYKTGTPQKSLNGEIKPRTILVANNQSSNGIKSSSPVLTTGDIFESHQSRNSLITAEAAEMSTSSYRSWGETACATLKIIGFPVYYLLLLAFVVEKWLLDIFARDRGGGANRSASVRMNSWWNGGGSGYSSSTKHMKYVEEEDFTYNNGRGQQQHNRYNGLYLNSNAKDTPTASNNAFGSAGVGSASAITHGNGKSYSTRSKVMLRGRSSSKDDMGVVRSGLIGSSAFRTGFQSSTAIVEEGWIKRCWKSLFERSWWGSQSSRNYRQTYDGRMNKSNAYASQTGYGVKAGNGIISDDDEDEDYNFIQSNLNVSKRRIRNVRTKINHHKEVETNFAHDVDSYDEDEELASASSMESGIGVWGFLWRLILILALMGALIAAVYWFWPVAASVVSSTWAMVYPLFSKANSAIEGTINACWVFISSIPLLFASSKSAVVNQVPSGNPATVPSSIGIAADDYNKILLQIADIQRTLKSHEQKLELQEANFKTLREQILLLQSTMKTVSSKDKSTEQIVAEIMKATLGVSSSGKSVTFENLLDFIKQEGVLNRENLEMNLKKLSTRIDDAQFAQTERMDSLNIDVNSVLESQKELSNELNHLQARNVDVDLEKIKAAILPGLVSEIDSQVKISCQTRDCPEPVTTGHSGAPGMSALEVEKLIHVALSKYDSDKTGMPDLALEPAGGSILSTRCTKSSKLRNSVVSLWGFKIWSPPNNPRTIIQPGVVPGECWAFEGSVGDVVIKLISPSIITGFTMEHIPKSISPYKNIDSAPKEFQVLGLHDENDLDSSHDFGTFKYEDKDQPLQYFAVQNLTETAYPVVELKIKSNHGSLLHTCLYRFRVHGSLVLGGASFTATVQAETGV